MSTNRNRVLPWSRRPSVFLSVLILSFPGCSIPKAEISLWPFYVSRDLGRGRREATALGPILHWTSEGDRRTFAIRPFYRWESAPKNNEREAQVLWPLGLHVSNPEIQENRLFPFYWYRSRKFHDGEDWDFMLFPFIFFGSSPREGSYLGVFPLGGTLKEFLAKERIDFVLFPLWARTVTKEGRHISENLLWPLIGWSKGAGLRSFRILPFYATSSKEGQYRRTTILWPFFHFQHNDQDLSRPERVVFFWPFYGHSQRDRYRSTTVLWPFFRWLEDEKTGRREWDLPWPFLSYRRAEGAEYRRDFRIWPFYGRFQGRELYSTYYAWPLLWIREEHTPSYDKQSRMLVPFLQSHEKQIKDGASDHWFQFWPLLHHLEGPGLARDAAILSLIPWPLIPGRELYRVDENLGWLWSLWRVRREADGRESTRLWLDLYTWDRVGEFTRAEVPLLFRFRREGVRVQRSFLLGLVTTESVAGNGRIRILGLVDIPFGSGQSDASGR
jgi:hypothetical protein